MTELEKFKKQFKPYAKHLTYCSRGLPSRLRPCNCGLFEMLDLVTKGELQKRKAHPELGPFPNKALIKEELSYGY